MMLATWSKLYRKTVHVNSIKVYCHDVYTSYLLIIYTLKKNYTHVEDVD